MGEYVITDFDDYLDIVEKYKGICYFRGQANKQWAIIPSVFRDESYLTYECDSIDEKYSFNRHKEILSKIFKQQHYGNKTRLCDLTINPLVALFFAIDAEFEKEQDGCVYIFSSDNKIHSDSLDAKILTKVTTDNTKSLLTLREEIFEENGIDISIESLKEILFKNTIIEYNYELAYSNSRAHLQGGTGIFFGFSSDDDINILRNNNYKMSEILAKIIIPSNIKEAFKKELSRRGITSDVLYDTTLEYVRNKEKSLNYIIEIKHVTTKIIFNKVVLWVKIDDFRFTYDDIFNIVNRVFNELKSQYGENSRIWMIVYYDEMDKKALNYICHVNPILNFTSFEMKMNKDYHLKRMDYSNQQISSQEIKSRLQPIVDIFIEFWNNAKDYNCKLMDSLILREEYKNFLETNKNKLSRLAYFDLEDIWHGNEKTYNYHECSYKLVKDIMLLMEEQINYLNRQENDKLLKYMYDCQNEKCCESYFKYTQELVKLSV